MKEKDSISIAVILYKSKKLSNGENPLMLRVTKNRQRKYVSLGISCSAKLWNENKNRPNSKHPKRDEIEAIINKKIQEYRDATIDAKRVEKKITAAGLVEIVERPLMSRTVLQFFRDVFERFKLSGQTGNYKVYRDVYNSFKGFACSKKRDYSFAELDYSVLMKYETWMRSKKNNDTTLSIKFRTLRSLFNMAIKEGIADKRDYSFEEFKISKFKPEANRRAITKDEIRKIEALKLEVGTDLFEARQIFLFCYYGLGINFIDIAKLRWSNVENGRITYTRTKTKKEMTFAISEALQQILNYWFPVTGFDSENHIFRILDRERHLTPMQIHNRSIKMLGLINSKFKSIGKLADISTPLSSYVARHTFATTLKRSNVPTAIISEAMGHKTEAITQSYLKSFENSVIDEAVKKSL